MRGLPVLAFAAALAAGSAAAQVDDRLSMPATPDQVETEMAVTDMLNALAGMGFAEYRSIRRDGDVYVVEVMTRDLQIREIELDPRTGAILDRP